MRVTNAIASFCAVRFVVSTERRRIANYFDRARGRPTFDRATAFAAAYVSLEGQVPSVCERI